jgi:hypothetical protein
VALEEFDGLTPPAKLNFYYVAFWIRMYNLPLACMGKATGEKIGFSVGNVKWMCMTEKRDGVNIYGQK